MNLSARNASIWFSQMPSERLSQGEFRCLTVGGVDLTTTLSRWSGRVFMNTLANNAHPPATGTGGILTRGCEKETTEKLPLCFVRNTSHDRTCSYAACSFAQSLMPNFFGNASTTPTLQQISTSLLGHHLSTCAWPELGPAALSSPKKEKKAHLLHSHQKRIFVWDHHFSAAGASMVNLDQLDD